MAAAALNSISDGHFLWLLGCTACMGFLTAIVAPLIQWHRHRATVVTLLTDEDYYANATLNWGLMQSHRAYSAARSTIGDAHLAMRRAVSSFLKTCGMFAVGFSLVCAVALALAYFYVGNATAEVSAALGVTLLFAAVVSVLCQSISIAIAVHTTTGMALLVGASPTVDLTPVLRSAESMSVSSSLIGALSRGGGAMISASVAIFAAMLIHEKTPVAPSTLLTLLCAAAAGHHIGAASSNIASVTLHHTVDDAIDLRDEAGRHAMVHALIAASVTGTASAIPSILGAVSLDAAIAFVLGTNGSTWTHVVIPFAILAAAFLVSALVVVVVHAAPAFGEVLDSDTIPRRCHTILWLGTGLALASAYGLLCVADLPNGKVMFGFLAAGAGITLVVVETAQLLARGPLVRFVCRASLNASTCATLASVDSVTLMPALIVATAALGLAPSMGINYYGAPVLGALALGSVFPAIALTAMYCAGAHAVVLAMISKMVPFSPEQLSGVASFRPPREQAAAAATVASTVASTVACACLIIAATEGSGVPVRWACVAAGALADSVIACCTSIAPVGAQARMEPRDKYGYNIPMSVVPHSTPGREIPTDRPPHVAMEVFTENILWCCSLAPLSVFVALFSVCAVGYGAGLSYAVSAVSGAVVASHSGSLRAALAAQTMRALHTSAQRGKLGVIHDPLSSATADMVYSRRVGLQSVAASLCVSASLIAVIGLGPTFATF